MPRYVLAIDQGTTSTRTILYDEAFAIVGSAQEAFAQHFPQSGWVEHDPEDIWQTVLATCRRAVESAGIAAADIAGVGLTNQRETVVLWDRATGAAIANAIVWQDRRTAGVCQDLRDSGCEAMVSAKTGLLLDPYFSATKIAWLLDHVPGARAAADRGRLAAGTIDTYLLWRLTAGRTHATDATNASRTSLFDIHRGAWDDDLLRLFRVPRALLPDVHDCMADFGMLTADILSREIQVCGVAGDQQAAMIGQGCFAPGMVKATYGTGCFALLNTGTEAVVSRNRLLTTIAYQFGGQRTYALEGSIFVAGAAVQWLRDGLGLMADAAASNAMAAAADPAQSVVLVPAFVGLGAPYWDADCRGALYGLTRNTGPNELARAALESVCFQTQDLIAAMRADWPAMADTVLRVDGGMAASDWTMQCLADFLDAPVDRPRDLETTARGAAYLAGAHAGLFPLPADAVQTQHIDRRFMPDMAPGRRAEKLAAWRDAVHRTVTGPA